MSTEERYARYGEVDPYEDAPAWQEGRADDAEPWWERFYDERDGYEGCRDEVEQ